MLGGVGMSVGVVVVMIRGRCMKCLKMCLSWLGGRLGFLLVSVSV